MVRAMVMVVITTTAMAKTIRVPTITAEAITITIRTIMRSSSSSSQQQDEQSYQESYQLGLRQEFTSRCVTTVLRRVLTLRDECRADVLVVLDGASPPIKRGTVGDRRQRRDRAVAVRDARSATGTGTGTAQVADEVAAAQAQPTESDRISAAKRAGASTSQIQYEVISAVLTALRSERVPFLVAPYEADGQLGYLATCGLVDLIVTDDTDLVGCGAPAILYKFSDWGLAGGFGGGGGGGGGGGTATGASGATGTAGATSAAVGGGGGGGVTGQLLLRSSLSSTPSPLNLMDFTDVMLSALFVAAGCDYCPSLKGVGVVTARKCVKEAFHGYGPGMLSCEADGDNPINRKRRGGEDGDDDEPKLAKLFRLLYVAGYGGKRMTREERDEYEDNFCRALVMYRHPVVFDPITAKCVVANDPATGGADPELITFELYADIVNDSAKLQAIVGKVLDPDRAALIAEGQINARSGKRFDQEGVQQPQQGQEQAESTIASAPPTNAEPTNAVAASDDNAAMLIDAGEEDREEQQAEIAVAKARGSIQPATVRAATCNDDNAAVLVDTGEEKEVEPNKEKNEPEQGQGQGQSTQGNKEETTSKETGPRKSNRCNAEGCNKYKQSGFNGMCRAHFRDSQKAAAAAAATECPNTSDVDADESQELLFETQPESQPETQDQIPQPKASEVGADVAGEVPEEMKVGSDGSSDDDDVRQDDKSDIELHLETQADLNLETQAEPLDTVMVDDTVALSVTKDRPFAETQPELPHTAMDDDTTNESASEQPLFETQAPFTEIQTQDEPSQPAAASAEEDQQPPTDTPAKSKKESSGQTALSSSSSKPLTQASSGSQAISSLSADPDALSPNLLEQTPPKAGKVSGAAPSSQQKSSENKAAAKVASTPSSKSSSKKSHRPTPPQQQMGGIQGVLARLMKRR